MVPLLLALLIGIVPVAGQEFDTSTGGVFSLDATLSAGPAVFVFWNSWLPGSVEFAPVLKEIERLAGERHWPGAIVVFQDEGEAWAQAIGREGAGLPRVLDRRGVLLRQFQVTRAPTVLLVDRKGVVIDRAGPSETQVRELLERFSTRTPGRS